MYFFNEDNLFSEFPNRCSYLLHKYSVLRILLYRLSFSQKGFLFSPFSVKHQSGTTNEFQPSPSLYMRVERTGNSLYLRTKTSYSKGPFSPSFAILSAISLSKRLDNNPLYPWIAKIEKSIQCVQPVCESTRALLYSDDILINTTDIFW